MKTLLNLNQTIARIAPKFPIQNYGWAREAAEGRVERHGRKITIHRGIQSQGFDCGSSGIYLRGQLREAGFEAELLRLNLPVMEERPYQHFLTRVELAEGAALLGFTPFEKLLGIGYGKIMTPRELEDFESRFRAEECSSTQAEDLVMDGEKSGDNYYPFGAALNDGEISLAEVCYRARQSGGRVILRASELGLDQERGELLMLNYLSFMVCFPYLPNCTPVSFDQVEELSEQGDRWRVLAAGQPHRPYVQVRLNETVAQFWPAFAALANKIAEIYQTS